MKVLVIYTHPNPESFNHALLQTVVKGLKEAKHQVKEKDLYSLGFNPVLTGDDLKNIADGNVPEDIKPEHADILWADSLIFIYPIWWYDRPALLKGWIDRVFSDGFAFKYGDKGPEGLLKHNKALVITTLGSTEEMFDQLRPGDKETLKTSMVNGTLKFCGLKNVDYKSYYGIPFITEEARKGILEEIFLLAKNF